MWTYFTEACAGLQTYLAFSHYRSNTPSVLLLPQIQVFSSSPNPSSSLQVFNADSLQVFSRNSLTSPISNSKDMASNSSPQFPISSHSSSESPGNEKKKFSLTILPHRVWECLHSCLNLLCGLVFDYLQTWWWF
ncbi:hypothetical protein RchiOBHm_Chr2g0115411 [Rosa chinensis]|uniref:Uncharacterized protein n=1 Tax=Rosa chinensis TaxID=74649 RepID=A0A2P6RR04_ROSCH|nr:hypothetical protein RchiOBHm_Chr2g0115411 [Rosa chinensis]